MQLIHDFTPAAGGASLFGVDERHQGLSADAETGLVYNRHRYLHITLGRFTSPDPHPQGRYVDGMNGYEYVRGGPVGAVDPIAFNAVQTTVRNVSPAELPIGHYNPHERDKRLSERRRQLELDIGNDDPIPDQNKDCGWCDKRSHEATRKSPSNERSQHSAKDGTPHDTGERNVNSNEEHSRRSKNNPGRGAPRRGGFAPLRVSPWGVVCELTVVTAEAYREAEEAEKAADEWYRKQGAKNPNGHQAGLGYFEYWGKALGL